MADFPKVVQTRGPFMELRIELGMLAQLDDDLRAKAERFGDFRPVWDRNIDAFEELEDEWFRSKGGGSWAALAKSTQQARTQKERKTRAGVIRFGGSGYYAKPSDQGPSAMIMVWTERLFEDFTGGGDNAVRDVSPTEMRFGSKSKVAAWHHEGSGKYPARKLLDLAGMAEANRNNVAEWVRAVLTGREF